MPYYLSERVNLRFVGDPVSARLNLSTGETLTVENGGLTLMRDGGLICEFDLPAVPGDVDYSFTADDKSETGILRVLDSSRPPAGPVGLVGA